MIRVVPLLIVFALCVNAQEKPIDPLDGLRRAADKTAADWETLAKGLEQKIATLLPCDPKARAAVEEVSHASDARLAALSAYLRAAAAKAKADTEAVKRVLGTQAALSGGWNTERAEADQERTAVEAQVADLKDSMRKRGSLAGAEQVLVEIASMVKARATKAENEAGKTGLLDSLIGELAIAYQDRQTALQNESTLLDAEAAKWNSYYTARVSRAITECTIISPGTTPRKKQQ